MSGQIFLEAGELSVSETGGTILVAIVRSGDLSQEATVTFGVTANDATEGADYVDATGSITFAPGQSRVLVPISILDDTIGEPTESFTLSLISTDSGSLLAPRTAKIDILDNEIPAIDPPEPGLISTFDLQETTVADDLNLPIAMQFSPTDSNIAYIAEKSGIIHRVDLSTGDSSVFLDISLQVNNNSDRGLLNFVLHPDFETNGYFYLYYVVDPEDAPNKDVPTNRFAYVSRFEADASTGFTTVVENSEVVLVGGSATSIDDINGGGGLERSDILANIDVPPSDYDPDTGEAVQDYIKVDSTSHAGGGLAFGPDGALYIATGDGIAFNFTDPRGVSVQDVNTLTGKILRIDSLTGEGLPDNPFATSDLDENASKVYQLGLRNPFRLAFDQNGQLLISETGWNAFEEINSGPPGANYGWPFYEGGDNGIVIETDGYKDLPEAAVFYDAVATGDILISSAFRAFSHDSNAPGFQIQAITGSSSVYSGGRYDGVFDNHYFFADFSGNEIYAVNTNDRRDITYIGSVDGFRGPVDFVQDANGYLYYIDIVGGRIVRIDDIVETGGATVVATPARELLEGSPGEDVFVFAPGTSTTTFLDTIVSWLPGDLIDLTALNITQDDLDVRLISGGATMKIALGFGPNDFQLKIDLNSFTQEDVLAALVFDESDLPTDDPNTPPVANDDNAMTSSGIEVTFNVLSNDSDADGDTFDIVSFTQPGNGILSALGSGGFSYVSNADFAGTDSFTYTIEDAQGDRDTATASIQVSADEPSDTNLVFATEGETESLFGTIASDSFVFAPRTSTTSQTDFLFDMLPDDVIDLSGLGLQESDLEFRLVGGGTILKIISGFGPDDFQLKVSLENVSEADVRSGIKYSNDPVEPVNEAPTARNDAGVTDINAAVSIEILGNDTDPENDPLTVDSFSQGTNGSVADLGGGILEYTPNTDFVGDDSFTYTISDPDGETSMATVSVLVLTPDNAPPTANDDTANTNANDAVSVNVLANDTDPENDDLTVNSFEQGANGTVEDLGNGVLEYTPDDGFAGDDSFSYTISDPFGAENTGVVNITVNAPSAFNVINANVGTETLTGTDAADAFTFAPGTSVNGAIDIVVDWAPGDVIDLSALGLTAEDIEVRSISGGSTLKLIEGFGSSDFQVKINLNGFSQQEVMDSVIYDSGSPPPPPPPPSNTAPTANDDIAETTATNVVAINVLENDTDPESDDLSIDSFEQGSNGTVGQFYDGVLEYVADEGFSGIDTFSYTISDEAGLESTATVSINVIAPSSFNVVNASVGTEIIRGTAETDAYTFASGTSVNGAIDTIRDWAPGDVIDLSGLNLSEGDLEVRTISGGTVLKLIEGFGAGEFHVKINLNGFSEDEVLNSVIYGPEAAPSLASSAKASGDAPYEPLKDFTELTEESSGSIKSAASSMLIPIKEFDMDMSALSTTMVELFEPAQSPSGTSLDGQTEAFQVQYSSVTAQQYPKTNIFNEIADDYSLGMQPIDIQDWEIA